MKFRVFFMIKVHVTPITPKHIFLKYMLNESVLINYLNPADYNRAVKVCSNIYIDNGAYGFYLKGIKPNYNDFYKWLEGKTFNHFFVPDILAGLEIKIGAYAEHYPFDLIPLAHCPRACAAFAGRDRQGQGEIRRESGPVGVPALF